MDKYYRPKERTEGLERGITNVVEQEVKLHYQEVYDRGYQDGINDAEQNHAKSEVIMANGTYYNTRMIDKSNFSQEQYKVDLQSAYDCGYQQARGEVMDFSDTYEEFEKEYGFYDRTETFCSANTMLIPSFRVRQWLEHIRLIDADALIHKHRLESISNKDLYDTPTIIEADKEK